jgi:hypothetical protein
MGFWLEKKVNRWNFRLAIRFIANFHVVGVESKEALQINYSEAYSTKTKKLFSLFKKADKFYYPSIVP